METKKYRFDEVTINFDKKRIPLFPAHNAKKGKARFVIMVRKE